MDYKFLLTGKNRNCVPSTVLIIWGLNFQRGDYPDFFSDSLSSLWLPDVIHFPNSSAPLLMLGKGRFEKQSPNQWIIL